VLNKFDICVIGAGAAGLSVAAGASQLGVSVALIEGNLMGGDCLNYGCVPSKSLLAASRNYHIAKNLDKFGLNSTVEKVDISLVLDKVREIIKQIEPNDSVERFTGLGVKVYHGFASFIDTKTIQVNNERIEAKYFVIATGARAATPPITGIDSVKYYTNETIFSLTETPKHLVVLGSGPIGCEIADAFAKLGVRVSLIARSKLLAKDDRDLVAILCRSLEEHGVNIYERTQTLSIANEGNEIEIEIEQNGVKSTITGSHLMVATGRAANIQQLNLEKAKVIYTERGITVNNRLQTSNKNIFALGDVIGGYEFTHIAGYHAGIIIRNILFRQRSKVDYKAVPWVTYTYPELAQVGLNADAALSQFGNKIKVTEFEYKENDRARTEREAVGKIKLVTNLRGKILGVSILGAHAGELLFPWIDLINRGESVKAITKNIIPYPTFNEINKQVVSKYYTPILFSDKVRRIVKLLKVFW
jgi:pyruvate/2-oxoglutarate dehydrogenase complex dihydrolipoamide dehydrogenase (E3) component